MIHWLKFKGYDDIGYSFLIGGDGTIYEGRGWGKKGSHSYCYNQWGYGIVFIGRYLITMPDEVMMQAYGTFVQVEGKNQVSENLMSINQSSNFKCAITNGLIDSDYIMCGHQDVKTSTACPGYRFETNWVKAHSHYGGRAPGGVSQTVDRPQHEKIALNQP